MNMVGAALSALPFEWCQYGFMRLALVAIVLIAPAMALMGTMAVSGRMAFFSDALGHSALTGVGIGILMGLSNQLPAMLAFGVVWAIMLIMVKQRGSASADTVISVFSSTTMALGLLIMAVGGGLAKYEGLLVGDVLSVTEGDLWLLLGVLIVVLAAWVALYNRMQLTNVNADWARSRGVNTRGIECAFAALMAVVVMLSIQWIGTLLINSAADTAGGGLAQSGAQQPPVCAVGDSAGFDIGHKRADTVILPEHKRGRGDSAVRGGAVLCDAVRARRDAQVG